MADPNNPNTTFGSNKQQLNDLKQALQDDTSLESTPPSKRVDEGVVLEGTATKEADLKALVEAYQRMFSLKRPDGKAIKEPGNPAVQYKAGYLDPQIRKDEKKEDKGSFRFKSDKEAVKFFIQQAKLGKKFEIFDPSNPARRLAYSDGKQLLNNKKEPMQEGHLFFPERAPKSAHSNDTVESDEDRRNFVP